MRAIKWILAVAAIAVICLGLGIILRNLTSSKIDNADVTESNSAPVVAESAPEEVTSEGTVERSESEAESIPESAPVESTSATVPVESGDSAVPEETDSIETRTPVAIADQYVSTDSSLYTYEQMMDDLSRMEEAFPDLMTVKICGESLDGRDIPEVLLGNQSVSRHIFIQASIHAREYINTLVAMKQIEQLLLHHGDGSYSGVSYDELLGDVCFHILPMSNPDGVTISQFGIEGIRDSSLRKKVKDCYENDLYYGRTEKDMDAYLKTWKANARGVDLNRNFDAGWETYEGVSYPSSDHYKGPTPVSEPETRAIVDAVHACQAILTISYHSTGSVIYWDYGSEGDVYEQDANLARLVSSITGYERSSSVQSSQDAAGCSDYFVLEEAVPSVTIENGYSACPIGIDEFPSIWASNEDLLPALAYNYR